MIEVNFKMEKKLYTIQEVEKILKISRSSAYRFIKDVYLVQHPFKVLRIENQYRIVKASFDAWVNGEK